MQLKDGSAQRGHQRFVSIVFLIFGLFFAVVAVLEIVALPGAEAASPSTLTAILWMMPILILSATFFVVFSMLHRYAGGKALVMANAHAVRWIAIGIILGASWETVARLTFEQVMPEMLALGGKEHLMLTAMIIMGSMLIVLSGAMCSAAKLQEEHDHIL